MTNRDDAIYEALVERLHESGSYHGAAAIKRGEDAALEGQQLLMQATGTASLEDAMRVALGRPRLDADVPGPLWKVRATRALDNKVRLIADRLGTSRSAVIRAAVAAYTA